MRVVGVMLVVLAATGCRQLLGIDDTSVGDPTDAPVPAIDMTAGPADAAPIDATPPADARIATLVFVNGLDYAGTLDTHIDEASPDQDNGADPDVNYNIHASGEDEPGLLQFTDIFGPGATQIPPGATIQSAILRLRISKTTNDPGVISEVAIPWAESVTWNTFGAMPGVQPPDLGVAVGPTPLDGTADLDMTPSLVRWSADPAANHGWIFEAANEDGAAWRSAEAAGGDRPRLTVTFAVP
jgi:hypothetical protein